MFAGKKSAQIREILISESAWEEMTCLFAPSLIQLDVKVLEGCTVLTAQPISPEESELLKSLRKVCKLSARK